MLLTSIAVYCLYLKLLELLTTIAIFDKSYVSI